MNDLLTTDSYVSIDTAYRTFLSDPVMRAAVNPYYEFQIDDVLVTVINNSEILTSDASNSSLRTAIRAVPKGEPLDIGEIPEGAFWSDDVDLEKALEIFCGCTVNVRPYSCTHVRVFGRCNGFFGTEGDGTLTITYDVDGPPINPVTIQTEEVTGNYEFFVDLSFRQNGQLVATIDPDCLTANNQFTGYSYNSSTYAACDEGERSIYEMFPASVSNERMELQTSFYYNFFGSAIHFAEVKSFSWDGNSWEPSRAALDVEVQATRKSVGCNYLDYKSDQEDCNNCKKKSTRVSWYASAAHCDGDVEGIFEKVRGGITLNRTLSIDFICCE